jgi:acetyl-CoA carboxylase carboxyl transferase subunit beta
MEHGMVDMVVSRLEMKETVARLLKILMHTPVAQADAQMAHAVPPAVTAGA